MVTYTRMVGLAFEVAPAGADPQAVMSRVGTLWNQNKEAIKAATVADARQYLQQNL